MMFIAEKNQDALFDDSKLGTSSGTMPFHSKWNVAAVNSHSESLVKPVKDMAREDSHVGRRCENVERRRVNPTYPLCAHTQLSVKAHTRLCAMPLVRIILPIFRRTIRRGSDVRGSDQKFETYILKISARLRPSRSLKIT